MTKVLISGFLPFGGMKHNPSEDAAHALAEMSFPDFHLKAVVLPVSFENSFRTLKKEIDEFAPSFVLALGLAQKRTHLTIERIGVNVMDSEMADNDGWAPQNQIIDSNQADGIFSRLPLADMVGAARKAGVESSISNSAGTYVCNHVLFELLVLEREMNFRSGFIHLPPFEKMALETQLKGLSAFLQVLTRFTE